MKRMCIFVFYDRDGIADEYQIKLIQDIRKSVDYLAIVVNGKIDKESTEKIKLYSNDVFIRANTGLDAAAFKEAMLSFCGWSKLCSYDEVILMNDTFFGPVIPFSEIFTKMEHRNVDFWGLSCGYPQEDYWKKVSYGYTPAHIQTFFVVFRKKMVQSRIFQQYWEQYRDDQNVGFVEVVTQHEMVMTKFFEDRGFKWDIFANTSELNSLVRTENFNIYHYYPNRMLQKFSFPVLKKKCLNSSFLETSYVMEQVESREALDYLSLETDYDTTLVWKNILRLYNVYDLYNTLHLEYIFDEHEASSKLNESAVIVRIANQYSLDALRTIAKQLYGKIDMYLIWDCLDSLPNDLTDKFHLLDKTNQNTAIGAFLLRGKNVCEKYKYICFIGDLDNPMHKPQPVITSAFSIQTDNLILNANYIAQVIDKFEQNPNLGVLFSPDYLHNDYFADYIFGWGQYYQATVDLAKKFDLKCNLAEDKPPISVSGAFWCRTAAIQDLLKQRYQVEQFYSDPLTGHCNFAEVMKRIISYAAQNQLYYSGIAMNHSYAETRLVEQRFMLCDFAKELQKATNYIPSAYAIIKNQLATTNAQYPQMTLPEEINRDGKAALIRTANAIGVKSSMHILSYSLRIYLKKIVKRLRRK